MDLNETREMIDELDAELISVLSRRMALMRDVALFKKERKLEIIQSPRENEVIFRALALAKSNGLDEDFTRNLMKLVMDEAKRVQKTLM